MVTQSSGDILSGLLTRSTLFYACSSILVKVKGKDQKIVSMFLAHPTLAWDTMVAATNCVDVEYKELLKTESLGKCELSFLSLKTFIIEYTY